MASDNTVVIDFVGNTDQLQQSIQDVNKDLVTTGKISQAAFTEFNKANQQAEQGTKQLANNLNDLNKVVANGAIKEYSKDLQGAVEKLYDQGKVTEALITKYGTATGALKAMQKELATMASLGQRGTKEFKELAKATAELQDTIQDTRGEIKKLASDTRVFDTLVQGARGMAAGFSLVTGTMAALGSENEDVQKTLLKVQGAMAALQGTQELANIATEKGGIVTQAATAAQAAYAFVVGESTGAMKLFKLALAGTGIGLAVIAITELVLHWDELNAKVREFLGLAAKEKVINDEVAKNRIENFKQIQKIYKDEVDLKKSTGEDVKKLELQRVKDQLDILEGEKKKYGTNQEFYKFYADEKTKLLIEQNQVEKQINDEADKKNKERLKKKHDDELKAWQESQKDLAELLAMSDAEQQAYWKKQEDDYKNHIKAPEQIQGNNEDRIKFEEDYYNHIAEIENAFNTMSFEDFQKWEKMKREEWKISEDAKLKQLHEIGMAQDKQRAEDEKLEKEIANRTIQIAQQTSDKIFEIEADRRKEALDSNISKLEKQKDIELSRQELTETQKNKITERYLREEAKLKEEAWRADQKAKAEQAIINGLLGATNAIANLAPPYSYIAAALAIATATADASLILSKSVPKFEKGTEYVERGNAPTGTDTIHAMVNEGERIVPTHINKQLAGIKNEDLPKLLHAAYYPPIPHAPEIGAGSIIVQQNIDYNKLGDIIAQKLKDNPQTHLSFDERGFTLNLIEKGKRREIVNNRYGL